MHWQRDDRVQAARTIGDGRRLIPKGERGTITQAIGGGEHSWLLTVEWDSGPGWQWPYPWPPEEIERVTYG